MKVNVLIADDDAFFRSGLKMMLQRLEIVEQVYEASNGQAALDSIRKNNPALVMMDIKMPEMDGIEATEIATREFSNLKVIAMTMFSDTIYLVKMVQAGASGYLLKGADSGEIKLAIASVMENRTYFDKQMEDVFRYHSY